MRSIRSKLRSATARVALAALVAGAGWSASLSGAKAQVRAVVDIAPAHSLVARVMEGVGEPVLIVDTGVSPHDHQLRPSQAQEIQDADVVFWIGPGLTPWLGEAVEAVGPNALVVELGEVEGLQRYDIREGGAWEHADHGHGGHGHDDHDDHGHDDHDHDHEDHADKDDHSHDEHGHDEHGHDEHGHDEHGHDDHGHDDHGHDDHGHDDHADKDEHGHDDHAGHDHGAFDPHLWLEPDNAQVWLTAIAETLAERDPANAELYRANAAAAVDEIEALEAELAGTLAPVADRPYIVFHDAYQYFERRFGLAGAGAIALQDATMPGLARIEEVRAVVRARGAVCVFREPQFDARLVTVVMEGSDAKTGVLDPLGADLTPGPTLYPAVLRAMASDLRDCLTD